MWWIKKNTFDTGSWHCFARYELRNRCEIMLIWERRWPKGPVALGPRSTLRQRNWKTEVSFGKRIKCFAVHTTPEELQDATITGHFGFNCVRGKFAEGNQIVTPSFSKSSILRCFMSTLKRNGAFRKRSSNRRSLKTWGFWQLSCGRKTFWKHDHTTIMWFSWPSFSQTKIQNNRWLLHY